MNTPAHLLIGAATFALPAQGAALWAALLGSVLPDLSLYVMASASLYILNIPAQVVFDQLYFSPAWQTVFSVDNSFFVWGTALGLGLWLGWHLLTIGASAGLLHLVMDFFLHAGDGRPQFWPLSSWVFDSPISYWDSTHQAMWVAPISMAVCLAAYAVLWQRGLSIGAKLFFAVFLAAELWVVRQWIMYF